MANNPLFFIDPRGDTLRAINNVSAERGIDAFSSGYNYVSIARSLLQYESDGLTFKSISEGDIQSAMSSLSGAEQELFRDLTSVINAPYIQTFEIVKEGEGLSKRGKNTIPSGLTYDKLNGYSGGYNDTRSLYKGSGNAHFVVAMDAIENNYYEGVGIAPTFFQQTVYHELGHGFGEGSGGNGFDQSIILENNYLRATGRNYYRKYHGNPSDSDHSNIFKHFRKQ